ncbi:membrane protein [Clostridium acetobutylicum]|nr:membrane protein [Clostridium acetobutylicum]
MSISNTRVDEFTKRTLIIDISIIILTIILSFISNANGMYILRIGGGCMFIANWIYLMKNRKRIREICCEYYGKEHVKFQFVKSMILIQFMLLIGIFIISTVFIRF